MTSLLAPITNAPLASAWQWFRPGAATQVDNVDWLFWFITWISIFFFVLIMALMVRFVWIYRHRPGHKAEHSPHHNNALEAAWSLIPLLLVVAIFYYGFTGYIDSRNPPGDAYEINVVAAKWNWSFKYPNGHVDTNLHVPLDTPVKLVMSSSDVLHSLYIPAFRVKMDCVPGKYTTLWFQATQASQDDNEDGLLAVVGGEGIEPSDSPGGDDFDLFCTEYCGTGHSNMYAKVIVHESEAWFDKWMATATDLRQYAPADVGEKLYNRRGCAQCHSIDGKDRPANGGPSFKGYYGKEVAWTNGQQGPMDENYIRESILNPMAKIRAGYRPIMPSYQGQMNDDQLFAIIQFIKRLNDQDLDDWAPLEGEDSADGEMTQEAPDEEPADKPVGEEQTPAAA